MEVAAGQLYGLHQMAVRASAGNDQPGVLHLLPEVVVELIAVAVALPDLALAVALGLSLIHISVCTQVNDKKLRSKKS